MMSGPSEFTVWNALAGALGSSSTLLGGRLVEGAAQRMANDFLDRFSALIEG